VSEDPRWRGDGLPEGLTPDDRLGWEVAATLVVRYVPDPQTGRRIGLSMEYDTELPKVILADQMMSMIRDLMTHDDFQTGVTLQATGEATEATETGDDA